MHKAFVCLECEGEFNIKYDMDESHYVVDFCPFCGGELDDEEEYQFDEEDDE